MSGSVVNLSLLKHPRLRALVDVVEKQRRFQVALAFQRELQAMNAEMAYWKERAINAEAHGLDAVNNNERLVWALVEAGAPDILTTADEETPLEIK